MAHAPAHEAPAIVSELAAMVTQDLAERISAMGLPPALEAATTYAVLSGGKRVRPVLSLLCCRGVGGDAAAALPAAAAVELVHCFSLIHDDLPALDDDQLRRGQPTLHVQAGEATAVLTGDLLLGAAFAAALDEAIVPQLRAPLAAELAAATTDMVIGQFHDTVGDLSPGDDPRSHVELIHSRKTGQLIRCACRMGAMLGGASEENLAAIDAYGVAVGLMFQVVDDLLDCGGDSRQVGKDVGKDHAAGKLTYPGVLGVEASRTAIADLHAAAEAAISTLGAGGDELRSVNDWMASRTA